jgi:hypothetical protein
MDNPIIVYLDRNIYDALNRMSSGSDYVSLLQKFIRENRIMIPFSALVLEETLPVLRAKDTTKITKEQKILSKLMDWRYIIKPPSMLLGEAFESWANNTPLPTQYCVFTAKPNDFFQAAPEETAEMLRVIDEGRKQYESILSHTRITQRDAMSKLPTKADTNFQEMWDLCAPQILDYMIEILHPSMIDRADKEKLYEYKCVELFLCYIITYIWKGVIEGAALKRSDTPDQYHFISASVADVFVTNDEPLFKRLSLFGIDDLDVMNLKRFMAWVKRGCR